MRLSRYTIIWLVAAGSAVAAGTAAIGAASPRPDVLTLGQATASLEEVRAATATPSPEPSLAPDEWLGILPSAQVTARCADGKMHLTRWKGWGTTFHDVQAGPAATVSLALTFTGNRVAFTGRCVDGIPTGSYVLNDEPAQDRMFGKWVQTKLKACTEMPRQERKDGPWTCRATVPLTVLSLAPRQK